jgi:hypothetical protein
VVNGRAALHQRLQRIPENIRRAAMDKMEQEASRIVAHMRNLNDHPAVIIDWAWGDAPTGALALSSKALGKLPITIYATAKTSDYPQGFPALARWAEFGTAERYQKTTGRYVGKIPASPYFYPGWRSNRDRTKSAIKRVITKAWKAS